MDDAPALRIFGAASSSTTLLTMRALRVQAAGAERDVEVVLVVRERRDDAARARDPGGEEHVVERRVAVDVEHLAAAEVVGHLLERAARCGR